MKYLIIGAVLLVGLSIQFIWQLGMTSKRDFRCGNCGGRFRLTPLRATVAPHRMGQKQVRCTQCGEKTWASPIPHP